MLTKLPVLFALLLEKVPKRKPETMNDFCCVLLPARIRKGRVLHSTGKVAFVFFFFYSLGYHSFLASVGICS